MAGTALALAVGGAIVSNSTAAARRGRFPVVLIPTAGATLLAKAYGLPPLIEYDFHAGVSSLFAAHEIYGDAKRLREIEASNARQIALTIGPRVAAVQISEQPTL